jgi:hypothetical protein
MGKMEPIKIFKLKSGNLLKIYVDENAESPREWDNLATMVCFHKRYNLGDKHDYKAEDYGGWAEMEQDIIKRENPVAILPLYLYDHSGITMNTTGFSCPWDSGQVGFIFISRKKALENWSVKRLTPEHKKMCEDMLKGEVETYDQYLRGEVYGFRVVKPEKCEACGHTEQEEVHSCWGFYGDDHENNGLMEDVDDDIVEEIKG